MYVPKFQVLLLALVLFNLVILFYVTHIKNNWDFSGEMFHFEYFVLRTETLDFPLMHLVIRF